MSEKALIMLENDYGFKVVMDVSDKEHPDVKVYDLDGNLISGGTGMVVTSDENMMLDKTVAELIAAADAGTTVVLKVSDTKYYYMAGVYFDNGKYTAQFGGFYFVAANINDHPMAD